MCMQVCSCTDETNQGDTMKITDKQYMGAGIVVGGVGVLGELVVPMVVSHTTFVGPAVVGGCCYTCCY